MAEADGDWVYMRNPKSQKESDPPVLAPKAAFDEVWSKHPLSPWQLVEPKDDDAQKAALEAITERPAAETSTQPVSTNTSPKTETNKGA